MKNSYRNDNTANKIKCSGCLFLAALIWGMAFVSQSKGMEFMGPFTFNGVRSFIGATVLFLFTTVGKAGFITTLYIVFVPILGIFIKKKVSYIIWFVACY